MAASINSNPLLEHLEDGKIYDLDFGDTWNSINDGKQSNYAYHTIKYDFKPASVSKSEQAELTVGATQDVSITLPNIEGSLTQSTKYSGNTKPYTPKECLMIIDPQTGKIVLERLSANVRVKNVRMENRPVNQPIKTTIPRPNTTESQPEKKPVKSITNKLPTQKLINPNKPNFNAPVKPMPNKRTLSPADDRLSDEESSPDVPPPPPPPPVNVPIYNPVPVQTNIISRRSSHTTLEQDLQLSDSSEEEI